MYKRLMGVFFLLVFLLTCVSALDNVYVGKQYEGVNITETCSDEGFQCDNTYTCNITIVNPDQEIIVLNQQMTRNDTIYNYTLMNTNVLGFYKVKTYCGNGTFSGENLDGTLEVTTTGKTTELKTTIYLLLIAIGLFMIALVIKNHSVGFISGVLFLISGVYIMIYGLESVNNLYTRAISLCIIALGALITVVSGLEWLEDIGEG